jgi:hypothetical protein
METMISKLTIPQLLGRIHTLRRRCQRLHGITVDLADQLSGFPRPDWTDEVAAAWLASHSGWLSTLNEVDRACNSFEQMCRALHIELPPIDPPEDCCGGTNLVV